MNKSIIAIVLILVFFVSFSSFVFAQTPSSQKPLFRALDKKVSSSSGSNKEDAQKEKIELQRKELIEKYFQRMLTRFEAAIIRMENIISRIETRFTIIKSFGSSIDSQSAQLNATKEKLLRSKKELRYLKENSDFLSAKDPKTTFSSLKQRIGLLRDEIRGVHQALVIIVTHAKDLRSE